jgi:hypothetical protein
VALTPDSGKRDTPGSSSPGIAILIVAAFLSKCRAHGYAAIRSGSLNGTMFTEAAEFHDDGSLTFCQFLVF